jgi:Na+-transporting methylmalonyl-CoA/oxaloacetate decarboxylase beta subunit
MRYSYFDWQRLFTILAALILIGACYAYVARSQDAVPLCLLSLGLSAIATNVKED